MHIIGWIIVVWLIGSILYSLSFAFRTAIAMPEGYLGRMIFMQIIKGLIAFGLIAALTG